MHAFAILADPVRRHILELLTQGERSAGDITTSVQRAFHLTQPAISQQLKVLRHHGFATVRIDGTWRFYAIDGAPLRSADLWLERFRAFWEPKLEALAEEVERGHQQRRLRAKASAATRVQPALTRLADRRNRR